MEFSRELRDDVISGDITHRAAASVVGLWNLVLRHQNIQAKIAAFIIDSDSPPDPELAGRPVHEDRPGCRVW